MKTIIDPPSPFAPLADWRTFLASMEAAKRGDPANVDYDPYIAQAKAVIAEAGG